MAIFGARNMPPELLRGEDGWTLRSVLRLNDLHSQRREQESTPRKRPNVEQAVFEWITHDEGFEPGTPLQQGSPVLNMSGSMESRASKMPSQSSESDFDENDFGVCASCAKTHFRRPDDRMIMCSNKSCTSMVHQQCYSPPLTSVPEGPFYCSERCEEIVRKYPHLLYDSSQETHSENDDMYESGPDNDDMDEADLMQGDSAKSSCLKIATVKARLQKSHNPITFVSMLKYATDHSGITPEVYQMLLQGMANRLQCKNASLTTEQISILEKEAPPVNIRRSLRALGGCDLRTVELTYKIPGTKLVAYFNFHYRCPLSVALDLYESYTIRVGSPVFGWDSEFCCTCSGRYPDLKSHIETMARELDIDLKSSVMFPVLCYCDESATSSRNVQFNPMWMHPAGIDVDARYVLREDCHGLVGLLPVESHLQFRPEDGQDWAAVHKVSNENRATACRQLKLQAIRTILRDWKRSEEEGYRCEIDGEIVYFRPVLFGMVTDMAERREHLCLRRNKYHCSVCYNFPGRNIDEASRIEKKNELRSIKIDQEIRSGFRSGVTSQTREGKDEEFKRDKILSLYGVERTDACPFTAYNDSNIFVPDQHPSRIYRFDALHLKHGVTEYFCIFADKAVNSKLIPESQRFGNEYLRTGKFSMHVMEGDIESFHVIPLTLAFGNFGVEMDPEVRLNLYLGACDLLLILGLLTDPCPKMILGKLKNVIGSFQKRVRKLLVEEWEGNKDETTKMHELFSHVVDAIKVAGHADGFSAKIQETMHCSVKGFFLEKSSRRTESVFKETLWTSFHKMTIENALSFDKWMEIMVERDEPFYPVARFRILEPKLAEGPLAPLILRNFCSVAKRVLGKDVSIPSSALQNIRCPGEGSVHGDALLGFVECTRRQVHISRSEIFRVLNSGKQRAGGLEFLLAYASDERSCTGVSSSTSCRDPRCRFQDPNFNLFCSSVRDANTSHGFPILFVNGSVILWPLQRVSSINSILPGQHEAIIECHCVPDRLIEVPFSRIRGASMFKYPNQKLFGKEDIGFVFSGRNVFGF